jgi:hypothetical protein
LPALSVRRPSLEDAYLALIGADALANGREEDAGPVAARTRRHLR